MTGFVTGTFDPITIGHLEVIHRAKEVFSRVVVLFLINPEKRCRFSLEDRMEFARLATEGLGVEIAFYDGLAVDYVKSLGGGYLVRGVRDDEDFEYEKEMADWNLAHGVATLFFPASESMTRISSESVRNKLAQSDFSGLHPAVAAAIKKLI